MSPAVRFTTTEPPFRFRQGTRPLLISMPHVGTHVPPALAAQVFDERQHRAFTRQAAPQGGEGLVGREHGHTVVRQRQDHLAVFQRHGFHRGHELLVLALRVVHQCHRGCGQGRELRDLARVVHAELDHRAAVAGMQPQQRRN